MLSPSDVGPTRATSSGWQLSNWPASLRVSPMMAGNTTLSRPGVPSRGKTETAPRPAPGQRTNPRVRKKTLVGRDRNLAPAQLFVSQQVADVHRPLDRRKKPADVLNLPEVAGPKGDHPH